MREQSHEPDHWKYQRGRDCEALPWRATHVRRARFAGVWRRARSKRATGFLRCSSSGELDELLREINAEMEKPSAQPYVYKESLQDYIYRRFFKAGVAVVLTVGCLWGAFNLLQIALSNKLPAIASAALDPCPRTRHDPRLG